MSYENLPQRLAMTIRQFAEAHGISPAMYFKIKAQGLGPREMKLGRRSLVTHEDAAKWRAERVAASNVGSVGRKQAVR